VRRNFCHRHWRKNEFPHIWTASSTVVTTQFHKHSLTHSLSHSFTHSLAHLSSHSLAYPHNHSPILSPSHPPHTHKHTKVDIQYIINPRNYIRHGCLSEVINKSIQHSTYWKVTLVQLVKKTLRFYEGLRSKQPTQHPLLENLTLWKRLIFAPTLKNIQTNNIMVLYYILILIQCVAIATEPGISLIILPLMSILQRNLNRRYLIV